MAKQTPSDTNTGRQADYTLPQWEISRRQRLALDERIRSLRKWLISGGLTATLAFSLLAGYQTEAAAAGSVTTTATPATTATDSQTTATGVFDGQSGAIVSTVTTTPEATTTATTTATSALATSALATSAAATTASTGSTTTSSATTSSSSSASKTSTTTRSS